MPLKDFPLVLFDLDETLVHTADCWDAANCEAAINACGIELTAAEIAQTVHRNLIDVLQEKGLPKPDINRIVIERNRLLPQYLRQDAEWVSGAEELLDKLLEQKKRMVIVTNAHRVAFSALDAGLQISRFIPRAVLADDVPRKIKPHPRSIHIAQDSYNASNDETVLVGDNLNDEGAAQNAGVKFILTPGRRTPEELLSRHQPHTLHELAVQLRGE
jgi:HAD superfamily hydrolase (TIGR01549 family)